ncbi:MAG: TraB/GumN family protein [Thermoplasmata archaeon]|nr:TraB/GumN family protein [Thermoplasmata archaeon]
MWSSTSGPVFSPSEPGRILLLGSAHVVDLSAPIRERLAAFPLQAVALELDPERAGVLEEPSGVTPAHRPSVPPLIRLWGILQRRLGAQLGQGAGGEMRAAARFARERQLPIFLIDDPFALTVRRLLASLSPSERIRLIAGAILGLVIPARTVKRELDHYTEAPTEYTDEIRNAFPSVARVLIDERNDHMAGRLEELWRRGIHQIAVVVGDAHVTGLAEALRKRQLPVETVSLGELRPPITAP